MGKSVSEMICESCGLNFKDNTAYQQHLKSHLNEVHPCEMCTKIFGTKIKLNKHVRYVHGPKYACTV